MKEIKRFSLKKLTLPQNRHIFLLLYWLLFGLVFWSMEAMHWRDYHPVASWIDALIPFCEWFLIPYFFWFIYIIGSMAYFFFRDKSTFVKYMWYVIITYSITLIVYMVYPTSQNLRPEIVNDSIFSKIIAGLYNFDTNTNVCPSLHVIGSFAVCFSALHCQKLKNPVIKVSYVVVNVLICLSTVFIKQHSIIDLFWGVVVSVVAYPFVFANNKVSRFLCGLFIKCAPKSEKKLRVVTAERI